MDDNSLSNNSISDIFEDSYGNLWIGTDGGGVNILNRGNFTFNRIQNEPNNAQSLSNNRIYDIYQDHTGTMWFGTFKGVSKFDSFNNKFALFTHNPDNKNSVSDNFIWSFVEAEPNVFWIGTNNGISIYYKNDNRFEHLDYDPGKSNWLASRRVRPILQDRNGNFWLGTRDAGLDWLDAKTGRIKNFSPYDQIGKSICDPYVQILAQDSTGLVWVGTANGLNTIDPESHKIEVYKHVPGDSTSIPNDIIFFIFEDSDRILWIATQNGLCYYNRDVDNFTTYKSPRNKDGEITSNKFFYLMEDSNNNLWVGTRGGGLAKLDKKDNSFIAYTTEDGLPNDVIYGILEDNDGNFWMSTNWGISKFNITSKTFLNYDVTDGLQSNEFNANACIKSKEGEMYFGGMKGFNSFFPSDIKVNTNIPKIVITGFKKFNEIQPLEIHNEDTIILEHNDNFFSFEFSALDYTNPSKNQYAYFLEEYNKDWTHIDGRKHSAEYTNVGPGKYIFRVIGSNNNNIWNYEGTSLTLIIQPPWYQTWLFRITGILFIISAIWAFVFYRLRRIRRKHEIEKRVLFIEKELFEIQQKALRLQMNPHFIFNSLNSIQSFILSNDIDLAVNYLSKFSQLMRLILANSRESIVPLSDEIQAITHYLEIEKLRFEDKFNYRVIVDSQIDDEFIGIPPMIIQPYIENAIIHGLVNKPMPGKIIIEFLKKESTLRCSISDDGIGRERAMEIKKKSGLSTKSRGMMITQERLEILNRGTDSKFSVKVTDLFDKNNKPSGTRVDLVILFKEL
nr:histidine kinase [Bacteroidota bacterium]